MHFLKELQDPFNIKAGLLLLNLCILHLLSPSLRKITEKYERLFVSFSGGFVVSYVFLRLLPGLAESQHTLGAVLAKSYKVTPFTDLVIYFVGLMGMLMFLGLQQWTVLRKEKHQDERSLEFYPSLLSMLVLNGIIGYTMPLRSQLGGAYAYLFILVMAFHLMLVDLSLEKRFPNRFKSLGRYLLALALFIGWLWAVWDEPDSVLSIVLLNAFLGGAVLMNVFRNRIPKSYTEFSYPYFVLGSILGSVCLGTLAYVASYG